MPDWKNLTELKMWLVCKSDVKQYISYTLSSIFTLTPNFFIIAIVKSTYGFETSFPSTLIISPSGNRGAIISSAEMN